jgi:hypothetical protein
MTPTDDEIIAELSTQVSGFADYAGEGDGPLVDSELAGWLEEAGAEDEIAKLERLVNPRRKGRSK